MLFRVLLAILLAVSMPAIGADEADASKLELATVIKIMMPAKNGPGFGYLDAKKFARNFRQLSQREAVANSEYFPGEFPRYGQVLRGEMELYVGGTRFLVENMQDQYTWPVFIAGPRAAPTSLFIRGDRPVGSNGGPNYFRKNGVELVPVVCNKLDGSNNNYESVFIASAPGKQTIVLQINKSTGSGGTWYNYGVHWGGLLARDLPKDASIGECDIKD